MSDWKPGDLAMCTYINGTREVESEVLMRADEQSSREWISPTVHHGSRLIPEGYVIARPLLVLDPEDREQVERLWTLVVECRHDERAKSLEPVDGWERRGFEAALREFANPTARIEEPKGLGAVVEDTEGELWIRAGRGGPRNVWYQPHGKWATFDSIKPVRVLSEGVSDD